ncbi:phospholipase D-like domain-containing protein [Christiangramia sabulilitoris]|uniref:phospholipase D n=1 Tax=Christiangramia sabulilitoris TaxID=2583991 RepID=A0A550I7J9_9FLAO|nr:phospholipase D-like domain-containing protein [Christiangramia sabulilitoris]TRO66945.1 DUF1669 domain-containing protein [Christiangramia sabulilitoris]
MQTETHFEDIQSRIIEKLHSAEENIRVAVAWFTDKEIIEQLEEIALRGVKIEIIISDNEINRNVDFSPLEQKGIKIDYFPVKGYGTMHHKFCIVDNKLVITGSYNWTVNAKSNNGENIHIVTDEGSINQYIEKFKDLKNQILGIPVEKTEVASEPEQSEIEKKTSEIEEDFAEEWNIYLNSKVSNYDKASLEKEGKTAAENTHGNPDVISNKMNKIYQSIIEDTEVDKKEIERLRVRLENKIDNYQNIHQQEAEEKKATVGLSTEAQRRTLTLRIQNSEEQIKKLENNKNNILNNKIPDSENKIPLYEMEIEEAKLDLTPPPLRRRVWLEAGILILLTGYLFLFYSSIIYTILYGREDAMNYMAIYGKLPEMEIFNSEALTLAFERGWSTVIFISFFTILPIVFGFLFHGIKKKWIIRYSYLLAAVVLDGLLAYLIAKNVYLIDYQAGMESDPWEWQKVFHIARFWIVLVLGAVPYLAWGALFEHINSQLDNKSRNVLHFRIKKTIEILKEKIGKVKDQIEQFKQDVTDLDNQIIAENSNILQCNIDINHLEYEQKMRFDKIQQDLNLLQQKLGNQRDKILAYLDSDQVPVSKNIFKERVTTFMSGWEDWLYSYYNNELADDKFAEAQDEVEKWTNETFRNAK